MANKMVRCKVCGAEIAKNAKTCPNCGAKRKRKKGLLILLILVVFVVVVIAVSTSGSSDSKEKYSFESGQGSSTKSVDATINESLLYDAHNVKIYVKGMEKNEVKIYIENDSEKNYGFNAHSYAVNGIMTRNNIYDMDCDVAAKSKANTKIEISKSFLNEFSITEIQTIDVNFWAYDSDNYMKDFDTGKITIQTDLFKNDSMRIKGTKTVFDKNNIKIEYIGNDENQYSFCMSNNKNVLIDFDIEGITINGYTSSETDYDLFDEEVLDGCQYVFTIKVDNDFMEQNEITEITEVQFNAKIRNNATYTDEWSTGNISVNVK